MRRKNTGRVLKVADLVDDIDGNRRSRILAALRDPAHRNDREHVDVILALGMAKEGFDWIWCEHALTVGYRNSLTEIVQIIGRVTRDAPGKAKARFTNLIAEPMAAQTDVVEAGERHAEGEIAASLLMEQVLAPKFDFTAKNAGPQPGFIYDGDGYKEGQTNVGVDEAHGRINIEIAGLKQVGPEAVRICRDDLNDVIAAFVQDKETLGKGLFDTENTLPQETTQLRMAKIVRDRYPELGEEDVEAVRQRAVAAISLVTEGAEAGGYGSREPWPAARGAEVCAACDGVERGSDRCDQSFRGGLLCAGEELECGDAAADAGEDCGEAGGDE